MKTLSLILLAMSLAGCVTSKPNNLYRGVGQVMTP